MIIYKATNKINKKIYIGQTRNSLDNRIKGHIKNSKNSSCIFSKAILKYGIDNFEWCIIDTALSLEELNIKEQTYINENNSLYPNGYNMMTGGYCEIMPEYVKTKISERTKEAMQRPEIKIKLKKTKTSYRKNKKYSEIYGETKSIKIKDKISKSVEKYFDNQENRDKTSICTKKAMESSMVRNKISERTKEAMQRPEVKERLLLRDPGSASRGKKLMNNGLINKRILIEEVQYFIDNGWKLGGIRN